MTVAYMLRTCSADMTSHGGFRWPTSGPVSAPDWNPAPECEGGLHGFLWGEGRGILANWSPDAQWLVVQIDADTAVDLGGKIKVPHGVVVFCGTRQDATANIIARGAHGPVIGAIVSAGYRGTATAGDGGTATAGDGGTATAGNGGTATAGYRGTATAGNGGTATAGNGGTATAGEYGTIALKWWDEKENRQRIIVGYVGEDGIEPNVPYTLADDGSFVPA